MVGTGHSFSSVLLGGRLRLALSTLLTRLPMCMMPLGLLLLLLERTDSYVWAGLAAGAHVAGHAIAAPGIARRYAAIGFFRPLLACSIAYPLLSVLVVVLTYSSSAWWLALPLIFAMGAVLPVTRQVLAGAWRRLDREMLEQHAGAIAPEAASEKVPQAIPELSGDHQPQVPLGIRLMNTVGADSSALLGPLLVAAVDVGSSPGYAVVAAALCALVGSWLLLSDPYAAAVKIFDARQPRSSITRVRSAASRSTELTALLLAGGVTLGGFGVLTVAVTGFAREEIGRPWIAGVLLAVWAAGGFVGGLWAGLPHSHVDARSRYRTALSLVVLAQFPLILAERGVVLSVLLLLAGAAAAVTTAAHAAVVAKVAAKVGAEDIRARMAKLGYLGFAVGLTVGGVAVGGLPRLSLVFAVCAAVLALAWLIGTVGPALTKRYFAQQARPAAMHTGPH